MSDGVILPLSTAQRGMWVGQQIAPEGAIFKIAEAIELHGTIDACLLQQALLQVTREMETLRVRIVQPAGLPYQMIMPEFTDGIELLDFTAEMDPRAAAYRFMQAELSSPFDFETAPVWVSAILKLSETSWFWYHRAHHIMLDGFSGGMVMRRVAELYTALRQNQQPAPAAYHALSTLIDGEAAYRASERYHKDQSYWLSRMQGLPEPATLARRNRPPRGGLLRSTAVLPASLTLRLRERVAGMNVSLPQALIALVAAYYFRMTGSHDLVFGLPVTARASGAARRAPGMVANAVPIRLALVGDLSFDQLFIQAARTIREALRHQQYRYEDLRRDLGLLNQGRQIARLGINIEPFDYHLTFDGVKATIHNLSNAQMEDLTVFVYDRSDGSGLTIDFDANSGLYSEAELDAHKRRLCSLIEAATDQPGARLCDVDLLGPEERRRVLVDWNDTADATALASVPCLVAEQALKTPDAVAITLEGHGGRSLTYGALNERSLSLAGHLAAQGIGPGDIVGVALPRSELLPAALLGILRAGAAYLPLDPDGPADRLSMMLTDANPVCVLTLRTHAARFEPAAVTCLFLDGMTDAFPDTSRLPPPDLSRAAYVIYTSGSTGRPKGVEVSHGNLANLLQGMREIIAINASDNWLAVTTITFDIAGLELFLPLIAGGRVVIGTPETIRDPLALGRLIRAEHITIMQATPSLWRTVLANRDVSLSSVHALVGGEALTGDLARRMIMRTHKVTNLYGPTETTIWSTTMHLSLADLDPPPIGRPIRNTQAYVLDPLLQPVPVGVAGMLFIGGAGVAKGYLNQASLTRDNFIDDIFAGGGGRLYRTGDQARWREDGTLEYLGRVDQQVKIRGHRIELGEIESHLARHEAVAAVAVSAQPDASGEPVLVAYIAAAPDRAPSDAMLRHYLAGRLPDVMIPAVFMMLDELPQTLNGKLDRKSLPAPQQASLERPPAMPRSETERRLVEIWQRILHRQDVSIHDNFFALGGDSLSGAELFVEIAESFGREIPFASLFRASTIVGLAELLDHGKVTDPLETLLPLKANGQKPPLFCVHPILGLGWPYAALIQHIDQDRPLYAFQAKGLRPFPANPTLVHSTIEEMAASYVLEMRTVQPQGPYHLLGWSLGGLVVHAMAAQLRREKEQVALLVMVDSYPFMSQMEDLEEADEVGLALAFLGMQTTSDAVQPATMAQLVRRLYDNLLSQSLVQAVIRTESDIMVRLEQVVRSNLALARRYRPPAIDVDAVFCSALRRTRAELGALIDYRPDAWLSLVGQLSVYGIDCHHQDMFSADAAEHIGAILNDHMAIASIEPACV